MNRAELRSGFAVASGDSRAHAKIVNVPVYGRWGPESIAMLAFEQRKAIRLLGRSGQPHIFAAIVLTLS